MAKDLNKRQDLNIQKIQIDLDNHMKQDEHFASEITKKLVRIDEGIVDIQEKISPAMTQLAVLRNEFDTHLESHQKETSTNKWFLTILITVVTFIANIAMWTIQHLAFK